MKKRLFSLLLALMLCLSLMPMAAMAAEETAEPIEEAAALDGEATPVTITSGNLSDHVSSEAPYGVTVYQFKDGSNFKLGESIDLSDEDSSLNINTSIALDLNGQQLKVNNLVVAGGATLTLTDSGENGELIITVEDCYIQGTLNANGGTVRGKIAVNKDSVIASDGIASDGTPTVFEGSVTLNGEIKGGVFKNDITISVSNPTISGGTFYGDIGYTNSNPCNITGGTFYGGVSDGTISGGIFYGTIEDDCAVAGDSDELVFMNGEAIYATLVVPSGANTAEPNEPTAPDDQRFTGWYTDADCTEKFTFGSAIDDSYTLYAGFESTVASATVTAKELTYTGEAQELVAATDVKNGVVLYSLDESGTYSETVPTGMNAGSYTVYYYVKANEGYTDSDKHPVSVTVAPKTVEVTVTVAEGDYTYTGSEIEPAVTVARDGTAIDPGEYTVSYGNNINAGTATVTVANADDGNYAFSGSASFTIAKATASATVTGKTGLSYTGEEQTLVSASDVVGGKVLYNVNIGNGYEETTPTGKDVGSYIIDWYVAGDDNHESTEIKRVTVTIAVPANVGDAVKDMTVDTVTSDDRETIEATQKTVEAYLAMNPSESERTTLSALKASLEKLLARLDAVKAALASETITDTDGITKNDVKTGDKKKLENAKAALEDLLDDYKNNLTATEQRVVNTKLERIGDALDEIAAIEKKDAEKDKKTSDNVAKTGDSATPILWIVIVVVAVAAVVVLLVVRKKKNK